jgi:acetyl-CoA decarbonylase/synthase complex subunit beta
MPSDLKEQVKEFIPTTLLDKIATELDVKTVSELRDFLMSGSHPIVECWETEEEESMSGEDEVRPAAVQVFAGGDLPITTGGFRVVLKNARIYADRVTVQTVKPKNARKSE